MPESSLAHTTAASYLIPAFQFKDAADLLKIAIERTPDWNAPRNLLALAHMQQADMEKARPILEEGASSTPSTSRPPTTFACSIRSTVTSSPSRTTSPCASVPLRTRLSRARCCGIWRSSIGRIVAEFAHEPGERTIIELMPTSEDFAVRTTGKPWIGTIGASTGPVITMVSPRSFGKTNGPFDWCDVTRHEFVHTVTLDATHHRIPRWFTEGLAVSEQTEPLNS